MNWENISFDENEQSAISTTSRGGGGGGNSNFVFQNLAGEKQKQYFDAVKKALPFFSQALVQISENPRSKDAQRTFRSKCRKYIEQNYKLAGNPEKETAFYKVLCLLYVNPRNFYTGGNWWIDADNHFRQTNFFTKMEALASGKVLQEPAKPTELEKPKVSEKTEKDLKLEKLETPKPANPKK